MTLIQSSEAGEQELHANICIIGSGAAGITLACELDASPLSVLLIEAGGLRPDASLSEEFAGSARPPHPEPSLFRRFGFGGTTAIWGGRCVPFDPIDFERRDYVPNSGWPISYAEVARYYPAAMAYCDAGEFDFTVGGSVENSKPIIDGLPNGSIITDFIERYSLPTNFGKQYGKVITASKNVTALLNARCIALTRRAGQDVIDAADLRYRNGGRARVRADVFVLAVGGIETPRILMTSDPDGPGLGNRTDRLGRFYTCHLDNKCGKLVANGAAVKFDFEKTRDGVYCRRKLQLSADAQRSNHLLNTIFRLHFPDYSDASHGSSVMSAIYLLKAALIREYRDILQYEDFQQASSKMAHVRNVTAGLPQLAKFGIDWLRLRQLAQRKLPYTLVPNADGSFPLEINSEQTPLETSRVKLDGGVDRFGVRRVRIEWNVCDSDIDAVYRAFLLLRDDLRRHTTARLEFDNVHLRARIAESCPVKGHHIGTARMATTERNGVVDSNCAVFGLPNLFIAGAAVFPTSSHANPTLTIVAMAIRLSDHLKTRMCRELSNRIGSSRVGLAAV